LSGEQETTAVKPSWLNSKDWDDESLRLRNAFRKPSDLFHATLGFVACLFNLLPFGWIPSLLIILVFAIYESLQTESPVQSYCDLIEFLVGFVLALPLLLSGR